MKPNEVSYHITLGEVCSKIGSGATPRGGDKVYISSGIAQIRSQNVLDYSFSKQGLVYIDDESATALNNVTVQSNDVLINITGDSVARACIVPDWVLPARVNQHVAIIRANNTKADNRYLLYTLQFKKDILLALSSSGATRNAITKGMLNSLPLLLPPLPEQRAIAATLSCLDDKIELNNRMNKTLEEMAQAIFKSWFVDFEPFQGGEFVDSEPGKIPKGWKVGTLGEITEQIYSGGTPSTTKPEYWNGNLSWLSSGETGLSYITRTLKTITQEGVNGSSTRKAYAFDTVIASAGQGYTRGQTSLLLIDTYINQSVIVLHSNPLFRLYIFVALQNRYDELRAISDAHSIRGSLTTKMVSGLHILIPSEYAIQKFNTIYEVLLQKIAQHQFENHLLVGTRDSLLPKLMSGEIQIETEVTI